MTDPARPVPRRAKRSRGRQDDTITASRRRRGAPPGNANALKHGFYSPRFKSGELRDLDAFPANNLQDEILMLRVFIRRVLDRSDDMENTADYISMLRALSMATRSITALLRVHRLLGGDTNELSMFLSQAITEVNQELRSAPDSTFQPFEIFPGK